MDHPLSLLLQLLRREIISGIRIVETSGTYVNG